MVVEEQQVSITLSIVSVESLVEIDNDTGDIIDEADVNVMTRTSAAILASVDTDPSIVAHWIEDMEGASL